MSLPADQFDTLEHALGSSDPVQALTAVWNILDVAGQVADQAADGMEYEEFTSQIAAQYCGMARSLLPLPSATVVVDAGGATISGVTRSVALLRGAYDTLQALAAPGEGSAGSEQLRLAARHTADAAKALASARLG